LVQYGSEEGTPGSERFRRSSWVYMVPKIEISNKYVSEGMQLLFQNHNYLIPHVQDCRSWY
jgi:hypothetical protein